MAALSFAEKRALVDKRFKSITDRKILNGILSTMEGEKEVGYDQVFDAIGECIDPDFLEEIGVDAATVSQVIEDMTPRPRAVADKKNR